MDGHHKLLFEVLPGRGWDNLRNIDMGQVWAANFSKCKMSGDGKYILPTTVQLLPRRASQMQLFSEVFSSFQHYSSLTAASINMGGHGDFDGKVQVSGSFSSEYQKVKVTQINTRSLTTRVQLRHVFYTAMQEPDTPLTSGFRNRMLDIIYEIEANNMLRAEYLADMVIADYGTHFVSSIDAGGVYSSLNFVNSDQNSMSESQMNSMKMDAAANFEEVAGFNRSIGFNRTTNTSSGYMKNLTDSSFITEGGPALGPSATADDWVREIWRNLVAVDRQGSPLFYAVSQDTLHGMKVKSVMQARQLIKAAIARYYTANTVIGCMERSSPNFDMLANFPSDDCQATRHNFTFGGVYQTCSNQQKSICKGVEVANPMTGSMDCSPGFKSVLLSSNVAKCVDCDDSSECPPSNCANYDLFWCASEREENENFQRSFLFGGVYNNLVSNPLTGGQSCPPNFFPQRMGGSDLKVCLSRDFELGIEHSFEFGGFFSCKSGNPYALPKEKKHPWEKILFVDPNGQATGPKLCPEGFAQHMADIDGTCEIMYCLRAKAFRQAERTFVNRPPFIKIPEGVGSNQASVPNVIAASVSSPREHWHRSSETNQWAFGPMAPAKGNGNGEENSDGVTVAAVTASIVGTLCVALGIAAFFLMRHRRQGADRGTDNPTFLPSTRPSPSVSRVEMEGEGHSTGV